MRTTIDLPEAVLTEAKAKALAAGMSLSAWVTDAVRRASEGGVTTPRQPIELPVWGSAGDPAASWEQIKASMAEDDERPYRDLLRAAEPREPSRP